MMNVPLNGIVNRIVLTYFLTFFKKKIFFFLMDLAVRVCLVESFVFFTHIRIFLGCPNLYLYISKSLSFISLCTLI